MVLNLICKIKKMLMVLLMTLLSKHPSSMCLSLVSFCILASIYLKSLTVNVNIYIMIIIFVGGILLLLFYLTMVSSNKPSWYVNFFMMMILLPELMIYKNLTLSTLTFSLEMFCFKTSMLMMLIILFFMLFMLVMMFNKMSFMRQL